MFIFCNTCFCNKKPPVWAVCEFSYSHSIVDGGLLVMS